MFLLQTDESLTDILCGVVGIFVKFHISYITGKHATVGDIGQLDFGASDGTLEGLAIAFQLDTQLGTSLSAHSRADIAVVLAHRRDTVHLHDTVAGTEASLVGGEVLIRL